MFFIIVQSFAPIGDYINKNFGNIFKTNSVKFAPIMPINDMESYHVISCRYSTQEELDAPIMPINDTESYNVISCRYSTQEELDALV